MRDKIRWGILATGGIARVFVQDLVSNDFTVQAVGSRSQEAAQSFASRFDIPTAHGSYEALVNDHEIDIVYIATPHPYHVVNAELALNAGKHVLIEKPLTLNAAEARRLVGLAEAKGLLLLEAMWTRFLPHMVRVSEIIQEGTLGDIRSLLVDHTQKLPDDPKHRINSLELGGGALLDLGIYPISFASSLFGEPMSVQASAAFKVTGADSQVATTFKYEGGKIASTFSASETRGPNTAMILGTDGSLRIDPLWYMPTSFNVYDVAGKVIENYQSDVSGRGMQFQAAEAERLVRAGRIASDILPPEESVSIMETLDTIREQIGLRYPGEES